MYKNIFDNFSVKVGGLNAYLQEKCTSPVVDLPSALLLFLCRCGSDGTSLRLITSRSVVITSFLWLELQ